MGPKQDCKCVADQFRELACVEQVEWQRRHQIQHEPSSQIVEGDWLSAEHHLALLVHERGAEIEQDVCKRNKDTLSTNILISIHVVRNPRLPI